MPRPLTGVGSREAEDDDDDCGVAVDDGTVGGVVFTSRRGVVRFLFRGGPLLVEQSELLLGAGEGEGSLGEGLLRLLLLSSSGEPSCRCRDDDCWKAARSSASAVSSCASVSTSSRLTWGVTAVINIHPLPVLYRIKALLCGVCTHMY